MTRLRTRRGLDLDEFSSQFGQKALDSLVRRAAPIIARGLLTNNNRHLSLTRDGVMLSDDIITDLF